MELKDFVSATLISIVEGVSHAQEKYDKTGDARIINPPMRLPDESTAPRIRGDLAVQMVEFDVAVTTTEGAATSGGLGIAVGPIVVGTQGKSDSSNTSVSRIKFTVPVALPFQKA